MSSLLKTKWFKKRRDEPIRKIIKPFQEFIELESSSGIVIIACVIIALLWINSPFQDSYLDLWKTKITLEIGTDFLLSKELILWINDLLMAIFFFLVGLEIKREVLIGELSSYKQAILPIMAAIGGMIMPALIYVLFNPPGSEGAKGWAVPMATDIALALGVLMLFRHRIPLSIKVFLTSVAIVDDIGAILVIALFYSSKLYLNYLLLAGGVFLILMGLNRLGVRHPLIYLLFGFLLWFFIFKSGFHATIAGILLAMAIPATIKMDYVEFEENGRKIMEELSLAARQGISDIKVYQSSLQTLEVMCQDVEPPLQRMEHFLAPYVIFLIMPFFALGNAGVEFEGDLIQVLTDPITLGIFFGLVVGKPLGVGLAVLLGVKLGLAQIPDDVDWWHIVGAGSLAGIGFTMSTFISGLAFTTGSILDMAKIGILLASFCSAVIGIFLLTRCGREGCDY
ncbi:MAG: Na+/H+ antiporter NhaA [Candidatus Hodarchaeales archaeon]|jgi:NhaA family Na+:H+ antiporter